MEDTRRLGRESSSTIYHTSFDPESEPASDVVESALSRVANPEPSELESIDAVVDPIVFDALVRRGRQPFHVTFRFNGYEVDVNADGELAIREPEVGLEPRRVRMYDDESPSQAAVRAIAETKGVERSSVGPLYDAVDPDALDALFEPPGSVDQPERIVTFRIDGLQVRVTGGRSVIVHPIAADG